MTFTNTMLAITSLESLGACTQARMIKLMLFFAVVTKQLAELGATVAISSTASMDKANEVVRVINWRPGFPRARPKLTVRQETLDHPAAN